MFVFPNRFIELGGLQDSSVPSSCYFSLGVNKSVVIREQSEPRRKRTEPTSNLNQDKPDNLFREGALIRGLLKYYPKERQRSFRKNVSNADAAAQFFGQPSLTANSIVFLVRCQSQLQLHRMPPVRIGPAYASL